MAAVSSSHPKTMTSIKGNNDVMASLPPIVPSIGFSTGIKGDAAAAAADATKNTPASATPSAESESKSTIINPNPPNNVNNIPSTIKLGNRLILTSNPPRQWAWKAFSSSARQHDNAQFYHWVRANVEYADYPYARFDVRLDPLVYTDKEYELYLDMGVDVVELGKEYELNLEKVDSKANNGNANAKSPGESSAKPSTSTSKQQTISQSNKILPWTKSETDALMELVQKYDLRWPVIIDRWHSRFHNAPISKLRKVEDLQHRYYEVGSVLAQRRAEAVMAREVAKLGGAGASTAVVGGDLASSAATTAGAGGASTVAVATTAAASVPATVTSSVVNLQKDGNTPAPASAVAPTNDSKPPIPAAAQQQESTVPPAEVAALKTSHQLTTLHPSLAPPISLPGTGTAHRGSKIFDLAAERARRNQLDRIWNRSKEEEREEEELRAELRAVEAQLRKLKKSGKHLAPAGSALAAQPLAGAAPPVGGAAPANMARKGPGSSSSSSAATSKKLPLHPAHAHAQLPRSIAPPRRELDPFSHTNYSVNASFADTAPVPTPGTPYLQSGRLFPPSVEGHSGLNKSTLKQMSSILEELKVPKDGPIPTRRCCDLYDGVRKDALTLLILQKMVLRKEAELNAKRGKLMTIRGEKEAKVAAEVAKKEEMENNKVKVEEKKDAKDNGEVKKDAKSKKASGSKAKAKRPRADSVASAGSHQAGSGVALGEGGKKGGDGPKKKPRKRSASSASAAPTGAPSSVTAAAGGRPGPAGATMPPPASTISGPINPSVAPIVSSGRPSHQPAIATATKSIMLPATSPIRPSSASAAAPLGNATGGATAGMSVMHPGKTAKKASRKPRGRKKSS